MPATVTEGGITVISLSCRYKYGEGTLMSWHRIALRRVAWAYQAEKNDHSFQSHPDRVCPAFKKWYNFSHKNKLVIVNQAQEYSFSLASPPCSIYQIRYRPGGCSSSNEHVRAFASTAVTEGGILASPPCSVYQRSIIFPTISNNHDTTPAGGCSQPSSDYS